METEEIPRTTVDNINEGVPSQPMEIESESIVIESKDILLPSEEKVGKLREERDVILNSGLPSFIFTANEEFVKERVEEVEKRIGNGDDAWTPLEDIIAPFIDSRNAFDLQDTIAQTIAFIRGLGIERSEDLIQGVESFLLRIAERKNYMKSMKLETIDVPKFYIWEVRNVEKLVRFGDMIEITNIRRKRAFQAKILENLIRLIKVIEGAKGLEDLPKINKAFDSHTNLQLAGPRLIQTETKESSKRIRSSAKKRRHPIHKENGIQEESSAHISELKELIKTDLNDKITEIQANSEIPNIESTPKKSQKKKSKKIDDESKENLNKSNKKEVIQLPPKKEDTSQKKLSSFFSSRKGDLNENVKESSKNEYFRATNLGNLEMSSDNEVSMSSVWDALFNSEIICVSEIVQLMKSQLKSNIHIPRKSPRLSFIHISDSMNPTRLISIKEESSVVTGRTPFAKDEILDYELDSEDEYEEKCCGEDLASDDPADPQEEEDSDYDSEEDFIVPDGYLSDQERADSEGNVCNELPMDFGKPGNAPFFLLDLRNIENGKDVSLDEFLCGFGFLSLLPCSHENGIEIKIPKADPKANPLETDCELQRELVRDIHGGFDKKIDVINKFYSKLDFSLTQSQRNLQNLNRTKTQRNLKKRQITR